MDLSPQEIGELFRTTFKTEAMLGEMQKMVLAYQASMGKALDEFREEMRDKLAELSRERAEMAKRQAEMHKANEERLRKLEEAQAKDRTILGLICAGAATLVHFGLDLLKGKG